MYSIPYWWYVENIDNKLNINISKIEYITWSSNAPLSFFFRDDKFIYKVVEYNIKKTELDINTYEINWDFITDSNGNKENIEKLPSMDN